MTKQTDHPLAESGATNDRSIDSESPSLSEVDEFLSDDKFFGHFIFGANEGQDVICVFDQFYRLAGAIIGLPQSAAFRKFREISLLDPGHNIKTESLIDDALRVYSDQNPESLSAYSVFPVMSSGEFRILTEPLADQHSFRINYWVSSSAILSYISLLFGHIYLYHFIRVRKAPAEALEHVSARFGHYAVQCRFINTAAIKGGSFVLQRVRLYESLKPAKVFTKELLFRSIMFVLFHEIAHVELGHISTREKGIEPSAKHNQEFTADEFALTESVKFRLTTPWMPILGAVISLSGESMTSSDDDGKDRPSHPSLVRRVKRLCEINDRLLAQPTGASWEFMTPYLMNLLANLDDRDRCPDWFGQDRRSVLGLPPEYDFSNGPTANFSSAGGSKIWDPNRQKIVTREIRWKDDL